MKTKYLVCEIVNNKALGGSSYPTKDDAAEAFAQIISDYGIEATEDDIQRGIMEIEGGYTVQILEILSME